LSLNYSKFRRPLLIITGAYWALIFTLTHLPPRALPHVRLSDKIEHLLAYGCLGGLLFLTLWLTRPRIAQLGILVLAIGMAYGAIDEWLQIPVGRDCDLLDWFSDTTGVAIAVVCLTFIRWKMTKSQIPNPKQISNPNQEVSQTSSR
jgi:VanZ family protein